MMSEKQFAIVGEEYVSYYGGNAQIVGDGTFEFRVWEEKENAQKICDLLNEQQVTIEQLKSELNNYEKITNLLADYDVHHYNRWINQIKNYVEKTNEGFEYNREFIIKLCLSYTLQSLRNGENLKRFQWGMINDE